MPELPEVEITARNLRAWTRGRRIERAEVDPAAKRVFRPHTPAALARGPEGRRVVEVARHGKYLLITLEGAHGREGVLSHLGMTGKWVRRKAGEEARFSRVRLVLDDGTVLHYCDPRLFGRMRLVPGARFDEVPEIAALGNDPLKDGIDVDALAARLARSKRAVKLAIMDQGLLPGVGNILASEALFRAAVDPRRAASSLSRAEVARMAEGVLAAVRETIEREEGPEITYVEEPGAPNLFEVYGRAGERCPRRRKGTIARVVQGGRGTYFCPRCQK
jgi:formamidopyrimidine-DNA glycosylase